MKNNKLLIVLLSVLLVSLSACSDGFWDGPKCIKTSKVISIDSIVYRGGWVTLEDGSKVNVGQSRHKVTVGYDWCTMYDYQKAN